MSGRKQLRREAAQARGRIDRRACLVSQRVGSRVDQLRVLARNPAALPVAFACGILAGRLRPQDIRQTCEFLAGLLRQARELQAALILMNSPAVR